MQQPLDELLGLAESPESLGYLEQPIPCATDDKMASLATGLAELEPAERSTILRSMTDRQGLSLAAFAQRMAGYAVTTRRPELVDQALVALALASHSMVDYRDYLGVLALCYHSAKLLGLDVVDLFRRVPAFASDSFELTLRAYPKAPRTPKEMGYTEISDANGFRYRTIW